MYSSALACMFQAIKYIYIRNSKKKKKEEEKTLNKKGERNTIEGRKFGKLPQRKARPLCA